MKAAVDGHVDGSSISSATHAIVDGADEKIKSATESQAGLSDYIITARKHN